jgi:predicted aspartyl protease
MAKTMIKFTTLILAGLAIASPSYATALNCGPVTTQIGDAGPNPVVHTTVRLTSDSWTVIHHTEDGRSYDRGDQYDMRPIPRSDKVREWSGTRLTQPNLLMDGMAWNTRGRTWYGERLYDRNQKGKIISATIQDCGPETASIVATAPTNTVWDIDQQRYVPRGAAIAHGEAAPPLHEDIVPISVLRGAAYIRVTLGTHAVTMVIDTGANVMSVTPAVARQLVDDGQAEYTGEQAPIMLADGSQHYEPAIRINSITIGSHTRYGIRATVVNSTMLLALPELAAIGKFTIDVANNQLIFARADRSETSR